MISLTELLKSTTTLENSHDNEDLMISGIAYHSQKASPGHLFVCIKGYETDGHKYLASAMQNGAVAAIVERLQEGIHIPQYQVKDSRIALAQLSAAFYGSSSNKMTMIGITATNGKTTTSFMTNAILENHGLTTGLIGTVLIKIDNSSIPAKLTTPESLDLQAYFKQMSERQVTHVCMEVSSAALESHRVEGVNYDIVTFNNLSREHIDFHGSFDNYFASKSRLVRNAGVHSTAILNLDDAYSASLINETKAQVVTFGVRSRDGHFHCKELDFSSGRVKFKLEIMKPFSIRGIEFNPGEFEVQLSVPGLHSVYNSVVAIIIALLCGVPVPTIQHSLKKFRGVERRFEFVHEGNFIMIDDHFANPGNIRITLNTLRFMDYKKLRLVYAIRGNRGPIINRENAETIIESLAGTRIDEIIATKSVSHVEAKDKVTDEEVQMFMDVMNKVNINVKLFDELPDAISYTLANVSRGDLILLAGCQGMDSGAQIALQQLSQQVERISI